MHALVDQGVLKMVEERRGSTNIIWRPDVGWRRPPATGRRPDRAKALESQIVAVRATLEAGKSSTSRSGGRYPC
jgi:hypothetical protein